MHKKLAAALTIAIFVLSSVAIFTPASAHFTLGDYTSGFDYHSHDFDTHLAGPTAYVWPGSGLSAFSGVVNGAPPGYQSPWPSDNPPGQQQSIYQLEGNAYAPFGAILTSTEDHSNRGPLIFAFNLTCPTAASGTFCEDDNIDNSGVTPPNLGLTGDLEFTGVTLYLPPEFDLSSVVANYGLVEQTFAVTSSDWSISQADMNDPIGPGWWVMTWEGNIHWREAHLWREWFYIRINDVGAPMIAGKYFFKMFLWDANEDSFSYQMVVPGSWDVHSAIVGNQNLGPGAGASACTSGALPDDTCWISSSLPTALTFPVENWPVLLVKGEVDPGIVYGTIRYGTFNQTMYGKPINFPGMVDLVGTAIDPYLPDHPSTGRPVEARGYYNASAAGHYEVEGVAPGVYTIYAQAAGYPTWKCAENVVILPGQSFALDCYLNPGAVVHGQIFSKHLFGEESWPVNPRPVSLVLFNSNDYADSSVVAWSPWNKTHAPYMSYDWGLGYSKPQPLPVAYPWDTVTASVPPASVTPFSYYNKVFASPPASANLYYSHPTVTCGGTFDLCGKPDGVGPAQYWWVDQAGLFTNGGGSNSFIFRFGVKGVYGAPTDIDGHIPQPYATWINGLTAGRYFVRAYINGYVQTLQDGVTLDEASFEVSQNEWAGDVYLPFDLRVSSVINKTIHFHDQPGTLDVCPISGCAGNVAEGQSRGGRYLIAEVRDQDGNLKGMNFTWVFQNQTHTTIQVNGFGMMGPDPYPVFDGVTAGTVTSPGSIVGGDVQVGGVCVIGSYPCGMKFSYYRYAGYHDYGLESGTYVVRVYMRGYLQQTFESVSVTLSGSPALISNHMYRGARLNITVYSIDWEHPRINRPWEFPSSRLRVYVYNAQGLSFSHVGTRYQPAYNPIPTGAGLGGDLGVFGDISGICNLAVDHLDPYADHCHIIGWDGYRVNDARDTPPDLYAHSTYISYYMPFGSDSFFYYDGFLTYPGSYYRRGASTNFAALDALETGTYMFYGFTYGYLQHKTYSVYVLKGGYGDIKVNLLQGVNITLNIPFKKEGIYSPTEFNMSMRVRIFDDQGNLVGTQQTKNPDVVNFDTDNGAPWPAEVPPVSSLGTARMDDDAAVFRWDGFAWTYYVDPYSPSPDSDNQLTGVSAGPDNADGFIWYGNYYGTGDTWEAFDSKVGTPDKHFPTTVTDFADYNSLYGTYTTWIPAGTKQVRVFSGGVYDYVGDPLNQYFSGVLPGRTLDGILPSLHYGIPGSSSTIPEGIPVSYSGKYYVEVDTWNEYPAPSFNGDFTAPFASGITDIRNWYPPVEGLLQGDSFHTIPGASPDVFGFTGSSLAANGLGPYAQRMVWEVPNGHLGSEVSVVYELDKRGFISGNIYGFTWSDELRTVSWANVVFASATGNLTFASGYSWDAFYGVYLDAGQYTATVVAWSPNGQGYTVVSAPVTISTGQSSTGVTFQLERSNIPIPEFSGLAIVFASALAASLYLLRRKRR